VCNVPDYCVEEVAEHTLALMLALARRITALDRDVKAGNWDYRPFRPIHRISGQVLGLVGLGRIARAVGQRAAAFGMKVVAFDPYVQPGSPAAADFELMNFDGLIAAADFISVHCPLTPDTRGLLGARSFERMKPTAFLVNCARGGIVDEEALAEALQSGRIAGAGLDVVSKEPMPPDHPLLRSPNAILTPHAAFYSEESTLELQRRVVDEVVRSLTGQPQRSPVNHPVGR
jgi:D-3-phosphoglycerate dehydrogenase